MDTRRDFIKKSMMFSAAAGMAHIMPASIQKALAIDPRHGSTYLDAEHIVILMQENRSFDHCFGTLKGVRGFNDPRATPYPGGTPVWLQANKKGETYAPFRLDIQKTKITWMGSLPHSRGSQVDAFNNGKHDGWLEAKRSGHKSFAEMPLTLGYYNREDLPFNYALADAFTICDQNFCSAMTSTTPNRAFFWSGNIMDETQGRARANIRNPNYTFGGKKWKTFPEVLTEQGINWKFYQNELSAAGGFKGEERSWLANFGCNNLEFFEAYHVKFNQKYRSRLQELASELPEQISKLRATRPKDTAHAAKIQAAIAKKEEVLQQTTQAISEWTDSHFNALSEHQKTLYRNAFVTNSADPDYRTLSELSFTENGKQRTLKVPAGDLLHQFRSDVNEGKLPTVSWLAGPQNYSDHPSAPWYGAWYVSEILDILTQNPEVWKKTIFILTYDENDGYYDHVPPYFIPDSKRPETGKVSPGIDTEIEYVRLENELAQGIPKSEAREAPVGLGFRVPMVIASPWTRGGKVCSQLFEHTSTLQFLESFVNEKFKKQISFENISAWRRAISGNLTAAFSPFDVTAEKLPFLQKDKMLERIYNAKFQQVPAGYIRLSDQQIARATARPADCDFLPRQERGTKDAVALPYELYVHGKLDEKKENFQLEFSAGTRFFGSRSVGAPFRVVAGTKFNQEAPGKNWFFACKPAGQLGYDFALKSFDRHSYALAVHAPNGFYRYFQGDGGDPELYVELQYELSKLTGKPTGNVLLSCTNKHASSQFTLQVKDNQYGKPSLEILVPPGKKELKVDLQSSRGWYDFTLNVKGAESFRQVYAGRVETGQQSITDPAMA
ncbi:phospholipase C [Arachidicoccus rhizosphaerae]|uniref:phospholipase C n=1 Tax=Arachidicoccus rhizosphaerae TaxID=551991 RepID=A0A1H3XH29_9BACT|nr:phospholipase C, phosphocholine-specific [Arachidicoccus rhizosphaerae]SDZ97922.1 phospholipase C [Arachidicoccus rhizosphaerae]